MAEGRRPGGLTALAVLNFVFGGFAALAFLLTAIGGAFLSSTEDPSLNEVKSEVGAIIWLVVLYYAVAAFLLIASGVGYLQMKRVLGRYLGNAYALLAIGLTGIILVFGDQPFGIGTIVGLVYPVITLALINTTFKEDLVN